MPLRYDGVIFDMDGTLVEPLLDFAAIRTELGVPHDQGILEALDARPGPERRADHARLLDRELAAAQRAHLLPGAAETLAAIRAAGLKTALLTRNARAAMEQRRNWWEGLSEEERGRYRSRSGRGRGGPPGR